MIIFAGGLRKSYIRTLLMNKWQENICSRCADHGGEEGALKEIFEYLPKSLPKSGSFPASTYLMRSMIDLSILSNKV